MYILELITQIAALFAVVFSVLLLADACIWAFYKIQSYYYFYRVVWGMRKATKALETIALKLEKEL